jgi:hypothetical protein
MTRDTMQPPLPRLLRWGAACALALAAAIAGCGGGVGVGGTGAYASGPITGFGSIFVNGIEFSDDAARVEDDSGAASTRGALRLGMLVEVESGPIGGSSSAPTASATRIRFASEIVGPVESVNLAGNTLAVFGQTVAVTATTVFDDTLAGGLAGVVVGGNVEVYGYYDAANARFVATRIEPGVAPLAFKLRGPVANLDTAARTFTIGTLSLGYTGVTPPAGLANGSVVRVAVATSPVAGQWRVLSFGEGLRQLPDLDDVHLRGIVTARTSSRQFSVNGQAVDAGNATFPDGEAGIVLGARVEVEGAVSGGVLRARQVEIDDDGGPQGGFELRGNIEAYFPALQTFVLRGVTVFYGDDVEYQDGTAADLRVGAAVEARGVLSADGTRLLARRIRFRD